MLQVKRHSLIVEYVVEKGCARVNELSQIFGVSPETIRRAVNQLNEYRIRNNEVTNDYRRLHVKDSKAQRGLY